MLPIFAAAAPLTEKQADSLTQQLQAIADDPTLPLLGLSVVAIRHGEVVYSQHLGSKRLATPTFPRGQLMPTPCSESPRSCSL